MNLTCGKDCTPVWKIVSEHSEGDKIQAVRWAYGKEKNRSKKKIKEKSTAL